MTPTTDTGGAVTHKGLGILVVVLLGMIAIALSDWLTMLHT